MQQSKKERRNYYLKIETIKKLERMAKEQNRKLSTIIDLLVKAA